jgi:hypothetical protein
MYVLHRKEIFTISNVEHNMNLNHHENLKLRKRNFSTLKEHEETGQVSVASALYFLCFGGGSFGSRLEHRDCHD